jgi:hypothetical protein
MAAFEFISGVKKLNLPPYPAWFRPALTVGKWRDCSRLVASEEFSELQPLSSTRPHWANGSYIERMKQNELERI